MSLIQHKSEPPSQANKSWGDMEQGLACLAGCSQRRSTGKITLHYGQTSELVTSWFRVV